MFSAETLTLNFSGKMKLKKTTSYITYLCLFEMQNCNNIVWCKEKNISRMTLLTHKRLPIFLAFVLSYYQTAT